MDEFRADDASADGTVAQALREMLERATAVEPPIGPMAHDALLAGLRREDDRHADLRGYRHGRASHPGPPIPGIHSGADALVIAP